MRLPFAARNTSDQATPSSANATPIQSSAVPEDVARDSGGSSVLRSVAVQYWVAWSEAAEPERIEQRDDALELGLAQSSQTLTR